MDSGYDPVNRVYLVVSAYLNAWGWFVNSAGAPVAGPFLIKTGGGGSFAPRVKYSPHVNNGQGGFLVTYGEEGPRNQNVLHGRIISFPNSVGAETTISEGAAFPWIISGSTAISYSPVTKVFLVAWMTTGPGLPLIARTVGLNGVPVGPQLKLSSAVGLYPGVAWNPANDRFGVSFRDEGSVGFLGFAIVSPSSNVDAVQRYLPVAGQQGATDVDINPDTGRFVTTWFVQPAGGAWELRSAEMDTAAGLVTSGLLYARSAGIGFSSLSVAFNPISRTFLAATLETQGALDPVIGLELNRRAFRTSPILPIGPGVLARNIRVSSNTALPEWNVAFNHNTQAAVNLVVTTTSTNGGPAGEHGAGTTPAPPPTSTPPPPSGCPTVRPAPDWVCVNGGWLPPGLVPGASTPPPPPPPPPPAAPAPPSTSCPTVRPAPDWVCVGGNWLPPGLAPAGPAAPAPPPAAPAPPPPPTSCPTVRPASDWVCVSGNWLPPGLAPAAPAPPPPPPPPATPSTSCPSVKPGADWICRNGGWVPPGIACPTVQPGPGWVCRPNGDWVPPGSVFNGLTNPASLPMPGLAPERHTFVVATRAIADRSRLATSS